MAITPVEQNGDDFQNVLKLLNAVIIAGQRLASLLSARTVQQTIESEQEDFEKGALSNAHLDAEIAEEIRELKRKFRSCISCAKVFLKLCGSAAEYGLNREIEKGINEELEQGKLDTLQSFLIHLVNRLKQANDQLGNFNRSQAEVNEIAKEMTRRYKEKFDRATSDVNTAREQHETASSLGRVAIATKVVSGVVLVGSLIMIYWQPKEGLLTAGISAAVACLSFVYEHKAASRVLKAENDFTRSTAKQSPLRKILHIVEHIETSIKTKFYEKQITTTAEFKNVSFGLDSLRTILRSMLKEMKTWVEYYQEQRPDHSQNCTTANFTLPVNMHRKIPLNCKRNGGRVSNG